MAESKDVNYEGTKTVISCMNDDQYLIYSSTGSNYGRVIGICTEETPLNPLSIYGKTKTWAEEEVSKRPNSTSFRFATAFGVAPKLRLDLLINDMAYQAWSHKYVVIYEPHFLRTFIHVHDIAMSFVFAIENQEKMVGETYNVGSNNMNFSKKEVCEIIREELARNGVEAEFNYSGTGEDADKRNYEVSYDKINALGFDTTRTVHEGIKELIKTFPLVKINNPYKNV